MDNDICLPFFFFNYRALQGYQKTVLTPNAMEFTRLVGTVLEVAVQPQNQPDPKLVAQLAAAMGNLTVLHKGIVAL